MTTNEHYRCSGKRGEGVGGAAVATVIVLALVRAIDGFASVTNGVGHLIENKVFVRFELDELDQNIMTVFTVDKISF